MGELGKICSEWKKKFENGEKPTGNDIMQLAKKVWTHSEGISENEVRDFVKRFAGVDV